MEKYHIKKKKKKKKNDLNLEGNFLAKFGVDRNSADIM